MEQPLSGTAMRTGLSFIAASTALIAVMGTAACSRDDSRTAGQGVDKAIGEVKSQSAAAKTAAQGAANTATSSAADAAITVKVNAAIVADTRLKVMRVNVDTKDGRVTLMGSAPDAGSRDTATALVKAIEGVVDVDNQLRVETRP